MLRVGLTGGIGSGKSTVASLFIKRGVPVIDADLIARRLVEPGRPLLAEMVAHFGPSILQGESLDRDQLRARIFNDASERAWLNQLLHPVVYAEMERWAANLDAPYGLFVIPLLFESGGEVGVDRVLLVTANPRLRLERVARRDGLTPEAIEAIMKAQMAPAEMERRADDVLANEGEPQLLEASVECLHRRYLDEAIRKNAVSVKGNIPESDGSDYNQARTFIIQPAGERPD